jgi:hypothetical protein
MIAALFTAAQISGTFDALDTTKVDLRSTVTCNGGCSLPTIDNGTKEILLATDIATNPAARLHLRNRHFDLTANYSVALTAPDTELGIHWPSGVGQLNDLELLQTGAATVSWQDRYTRLALAEAGSFGQLNSALLYTLPTQPGQVAGMAQTALAPVTITYGSTDTTAAVSMTPARHATLVVTGEYFGSGPLSAFHQNVLADQHTNRATASFGYLLSRTDTIHTLADAWGTWTWGPCAPGFVVMPGIVIAPTATVPNCAERDILYELREVLHHSFSRTTTLDMGAGAAVYGVSVPGVDETVLAPDVVASLSQRLGRRASSALLFSIVVSPVVDSRTGIADERLQATATWSQILPSNVTLSLTSGLLDSLPALTSAPGLNPYPLTVVSAGADAQLHVDREIDVGLGEQTFWQTQKSFGTFFSTLAYVTVTAHAPTLDFGSHHVEIPATGVRAAAP